MVFMLMFLPIIKVCNMCLRKKDLNFCQRRWLELLKDYDMSVLDLTHIYMPKLPIFSHVKIEFKNNLESISFICLTCDDCALKQMIRCFTNFQGNRVDSKKEEERKRENKLRRKAPRIGVIPGARRQGNSYSSACQAQCLARRATAGTTEGFAWRGSSTRVRRAQ